MISNFIKTAVQAVNIRFQLVGRRGLKVIWTVVVVSAIDGAEWPAAAQSNVYLPVYRVTQSGATISQGTNLARHLNIPLSQLSQSNGVVSFIDPTNYLAVPTIPATDSTVISNQLAVTRNQYAAIPITIEQIDFRTLTNQPVFNTNTAVALFSNALASASLIPEVLYNGFIYGIPAPSYTRFNGFYTNHGVVISANQVLETKIDYLMYAGNGYPFVGPGMQVQASFDGNGNATRLLYAARQLTNDGQFVAIVPPDVASNRAAALFPANTRLSLQLVYWCPPFRPLLGSTSAWNPANILPWYSCHGVLNVTNPSTGLISPVNLRGRMIPATDDSGFIPNVSLFASAPNSTQVVANAYAFGGTPPYTYIWSGSDSTISTTNSPVLTYTPTVRFAPPLLQVEDTTTNYLVIYWNFHPPGPGPDPGPDAWVLESRTNLSPGLSFWTQVTNPVLSNNGFYSVALPRSARAGFFRLRLATPTLSETENLSVSVLDANGLFVHTNFSLIVQAQIVPAAKGTHGISYGTESPREPDFAIDRVGWQQGMSTPNAGGGSESFCWMGNLVWPGDFIEPNPPGTLVATPWVYGDADYSNWGVNAASIVLNNTDGDPDGFAASQPGATIAQYATALLHRPGFAGGTVVINLNQYQNTVNTHSYNINYNGSWGPLLPNDDLCWLCMDCCDVLDQFNGTGVSATDRWSPAFGGLHLLTGWNSTEQVGDGSFEKDFAQNMLGVHGAAQTVLQAWFNSAHAAGASHGVPAAMGAFGPNSISDYKDYYWGKGAVNPSIPQNQVTGWWYVQDTLPANPP